MFCLTVWEHHICVVNVVVPNARSKEGLTSAVSAMARAVLMISFTPGTGDTSATLSITLSVLMSSDRELIALEGITVRRGRGPRSVRSDSG